MNYPKLFSARLIICLVLVSTAIWSGCTKNYYDINTDPTRITTLSTEDIKGLFTNFLIYFRI